MRLAVSSVPHKNQIHLTSVIQLPETSIDSQQKVQLENLKESKFNENKFPAKFTIFPQAEVTLRLENLIQQQESELSLISIPSASLPKVNSNSSPISADLKKILEPIAGHQMLPKEKRNNHLFAQETVKSDTVSELISSNNDKIMSEPLFYENGMRSSRKTDQSLPEDYFLSESIGAMNSLE
jgi:hypothetical protein